MASAFEPSRAHAEMKAALDEDGTRERSVAIAIGRKHTEDSLQVWRWAAAYFLRPTDIVNILHCVSTDMEGAAFRLVGLFVCSST